MKMRKRFFLSILVFCMVIAATTPVYANKSSRAIYWTRAEINELVGNLGSVLSNSSRADLTQYLEDTLDAAGTVLAQGAIDHKTGLATKRALQYASRLGVDLNSNSSLWTDAPFAIYEVNALSPDMRVPDIIPADGKISEKISVISAQNEYEAASFVLAPLADVEAVEFTISDLQSDDDNVIAASQIDMRVVKHWYQLGTAWHSYFYDPYKKVLTPELLLHDENLIKVDHETQKNYLRIDYPTGSVYKDTTSPINMFEDPIEDSPVLLPIELKQGESKEMWITTKVDTGTPEGIYTGTIDITADGVQVGQLTLEIQVLPFELPKPKTYHNVEKDFRALMYTVSRVKDYMAKTGNNAELVDTKLLNEYKNMVEHGLTNISSYYYEADKPEQFIRQYELMKEAGFDMSFILGVKQTFPNNGSYTAFSNYLTAKAAYEANPTPANEDTMNALYATHMQFVEDWKVVLRDTYDAVTEIVGHNNLYFDAWDEAALNRLLWQQEWWTYIQEELGAKVYATGHDLHLGLDVKEQFLNWVGEPTREKADAWHAFGEDKMITNYALPHTAPENPDFMRQRHGMWPYKANYDAIYNYIYYENWNGTAWNDEIDGTFRNLTIVYPTKTDIIDTTAWEGFREGIDDTRYATKLKQLAQEAIASGDAERIAAATKAEAWLEETDERSTNSSLLRLEMIYHILTMLKLAE